jgi:two-component system, chemotaxis family, protein-glutamate methylesterase/glutaminase
MTLETVIPERSLASRAIAIVTSAGGLTAVSRLLGALPPTLPACVLLVQHLHESQPSHLVEILRLHTGLLVRQASEGARLEVGTVYVGPPGVHLMVGLDRRVELSHLPPVHYCRPSGDRLFTSVGESFGNRGIAVVLTGTGRDGAEGAQALRRAGGTVIVQDEPSSEFTGMPHAAVHAGVVDHVLPLGAIAHVLQELVAEEVVS